MTLLLKSVFRTVRSSANLEEPQGAKNRRLWPSYMIVKASHCKDKSRAMNQSTLLCSSICLDLASQNWFDYSTVGQRGQTACLIKHLLRRYLMVNALPSTTGVGGCGERISSPIGLPVRRT